MRRFTEKPDAEKAAAFVAAGNYLWNSGIVLWSARTLANALHEHLPKAASLLEEVAAAFGTRKFAATFHRLYPKCENISVDYAVPEPRSAKGEHGGNIICLLADFGWNEVDSWNDLYEHHSAMSSPPKGNVIFGAGEFVLNAHDNYVYAPGKFVATVGISDLVVVEAQDALLITTRQHAQDVGKVVSIWTKRSCTNWCKVPGYATPSQPASFRVPPFPEQPKAIQEDRDSANQGGKEKV